MYRTREGAAREEEEEVVCGGWSMGTSPGEHKDG